MSADLRNQIRSLRTAERRIVPDAAWVSRTREALVKEVVRTQPTERMSLAARATDFWTSLISSRIANLVRKPIMAVLSAFVVISGGSILSVSAAERSLPGDFFYGLKLVTEQARLALTSAREDRLALKTEFTERRVDELKQVSAKPENVAQVTEILKRDLDTVKQQLTDVKENTSPKTRVAAAKLVDQKTIKVINALEEAKASLTPEQKGKVTEVQSIAAEASVSAIQVLAETHESNGEEVNAEDVAQAIEDHTKTVAGVTSEPITLSASSTSSTFVSIPESLSASSTLPQIVDQVKDLTTQAFANQMTKDGIASASSTSAEPLADGSATGTASATGTTPLVTESPSSTSATGTPGTAP